MDVTDATFEEEVLRRSHEVPVVVDFWAAWCGPCRQLGPVIETAVARRHGDVLLAKVDIDANPALAQKYRIMSIPAVKAFRAGAVVTEFVGMQAPATIEAFLDRVVPSQADRLVAAGDEESLREAVSRDPAHVGARVALARLLWDDERAEEIEPLLTPVEFDADARGLLALARLEKVQTPDVVAGLAGLRRGDHEAGLGYLLDAVRTADRSARDDIRAAMIGIFRHLGDQHPLTTRFRRKLAQALY